VATNILLIAGFALATAAGALVRIPLPFTPVPVTLQTLMVLLAGAMLGSGRGAASQLLYLSGGLAGLPFFAGSAAGLAVLAGPTGGYIAGFVVAALVAGRLAPRTRSWIGTAGVFTLATAVILALGALHLALFYTGGRVGAALTLGAVPFLPGAAIKIGVATAMYRAWRRIRPGN
jgi:biotin transport system substrate-specific component